MANGYLCHDYGNGEGPGAPVKIFAAAQKGIPQLLTLPMEILTEILSYLEWDDLLHTRQTCHHLRQASCSKSVWLALVKRYIAFVRPRPLWPEKPLDRHISRELELLVLQWKRIKTGWAMNRLSEHIPRQRHFFTDNPAAFNFRCIYLVEGGRWLLVGTRLGSIQYYDLNAVTISASPLIPSPIDGQSEIQISVDTDSATESLTFLIGVLTRGRSNGDLRSPQRWIQVWRVTPEVDPSGYVTGLNAEIQSSFREEHEPACVSFRLRGQLVAYSMFYSYLQVGPFNGGHKIIIVNWKTCNSTSLNYNRKIIVDQANWLALLPGDRLLCYIDGDFTLYDLVNAPITTFPSQHPKYTSTFTFAASCQVKAHAISQPFFIQNSTRFTFLTEGGVKGMTIPNDVSELDLIELLPLAGKYLGDSICMNYNLAAVIHFWPTILILQFAWPEEDPYSIVSRHTITREGTFAGDPSLNIDLSSGRVVISGDGRGKQYVLEP